MQTYLLKFVFAVLCLAMAGRLTAEQTMAQLTLSDTDAQRYSKVAMKAQPDSIILTSDQKAAMAANRLIDAKTGPLAYVEFTDAAAKHSVELTSPASVMIPYTAPEGVRDADLDVFAWDAIDKTWRLAGMTLDQLPDLSYQVVSSAQVYPALHSILAKPVRLTPLAVFKRNPDQGPSPAVAQKTKPVKKIDKGSFDVRENGAFYFINTGQIELVIEKATGAIYRYRLLQPAVYDFTPDGLGGLKVYVINKSKKSGGLYDIAKSIDFSTQNFQGEDYLVIDIALASNSDSLLGVAKAHLQYRVGKSMAFVRSDFTFANDDPSQFEFGVWQRYDGMEWTRQMFPTIAETVERPSFKKCLARYSDYEEDATFEMTAEEKAAEEQKKKDKEAKQKEDEKYSADNSSDGNLKSAQSALKANLQETEALRSVAMPWSVVEGARWFLMYGYLDLNTAMIASPNRFKGMPSFSYQPKGVKKDHTYTIDYFLRFFPKPENTVTDVCKWYAINRYSTNALDKDYAKHPAADTPKRTLFHGHFLGDKGTMNPHPAYWTYDEMFPTTGTWLNFVAWDNEKAKTVYEMNPEQLMGIIKKAQADGGRVYPYARQIRYWYAYHEDRPPYMRWMLKAKHGYPFSYNLGSLPADEQVKQMNRWLPDSTAQALGYRPGSKVSMVEVHDDFCDPEFVDWYIKDKNNYLDYYGINGYYFDMGWDTHVSPCWRHPDGGIFHGELKAIAEVTNHGRQVNPANRFFMNQNIHSPCMDFIDATYINEGGVGANKLAIDSVKFNRTTFCNLIYAGQWDEYYGSKTKAAQMIVLRAMENLAHGILFSSTTAILKEGAKTTEYVDFAASATPLTLVYENDALVFVDNDGSLNGSVWAADTGCQMAIFNSSETPKHFTAYVNEKLVKAYGYQKPVSFGFKIQGCDGLEEGAVDVKASAGPEGWLKVEGTLPGNKLLMAR